MSAQILLVEDEPALRYFLGRTLEDAGYAVTAAATGREALSRQAEHEFHLALVDLRLPDMSGLQVIEHLQQDNPGIVAIIITAHADLESALAALRAGVHDYLLKPVHLQQLLRLIEDGLTQYHRQKQQHELLSRIEETSRQLREIFAGEPPGEPAAPAAAQFGQWGDLVLDEKGFAAWWQGQPLALTSIEFALLAALAHHCGEVVSCAQLVRAVHGYDLIEPSARELVKPHIHRLRLKIEPDSTRSRHLLNVRGRGYKFVP